MSDRGSILSELIRAKGDQLTYRWRPVRKTESNKTNPIVNLGRAFTEEVLFYPSKVWTLTGIFRAKSKIKPGIITALYLSIMSLLILMPWFLMQAVLYQVVRLLRAGWYMLRGQVVYQPKAKKD